MNETEDRGQGTAGVGPAFAKRGGGFFRRFFGYGKAELQDQLFNGLRNYADEQRRNQVLTERIRRMTEAGQATLDKYVALQSKRNVARIMPAKRMPDVQVLAAFNVPLESGLPAALHQELDDAIQDLVEQVSLPPHGEFKNKDGSITPAFTEEMRTHFAGGLEHVRAFQKRLLDLSASANKADLDPENEDLDKPEEQPAKAS